MGRSRQPSYADYPRPRVRVTLTLSRDIVHILRAYAKGVRRVHLSQTAEQALRIGLGEIPPPEFRERHRTASPTS